MSELLTRAMRTDDSELLFSDYFNDYGSMKPILFLLSFSLLFQALSTDEEWGIKKNFSMHSNSRLQKWKCNFSII